MIDFGISAQTFRGEVFERAPYLKRDALVGAGISWGELEELLERIEPRAPDVRLYRGSIVPEELYTEEIVEAGARRRRFRTAAFYAQMQRGAALILNRLEHQLPFARRLCDTIARFSTAQTTANAYLSFGGEGSFGTHWDTHDVFAVQVLGRKRWQVFEPTLPLPLSHHTSVGAEPPARPPVLDCVLEPGDLLYMPRGWWHRTIPFQEGSFHVSVGTYAATVYDYVLWSCARELASIVDVRRAFQVGNVSGALAQTQAVLARVLDDASLQRMFEDEIAGRERVKRDLNLQLWLDRTHGPPHASARVRLASCYGAVMSKDEIRINGERLRLDRLNSAIVGLLAEGAALEVGELQLRTGATPEALSEALFALASHDIVTIEASNP